MESFDESHHLNKEILLIDDDPNITSSLKRLLQKEYLINVANNLDEAYSCLQQKEYSLIILDFDLKDTSNGIEISNYIQDISPLTYKIMLTGTNEFRVVKKAINEGSINYFLLKPFEAKRIKNIVIQGIERYNTNKRLYSFLSDANGMNSAKKFIKSVIQDKFQDQNIVNGKYYGIIISKGSLPVYSNFEGNGVFNQFPDTLFAGFMSALILVGDEVFISTDKVNQLIFDNISIVFKYFNNYQISYIIEIPTDEISYDLDIELDRFRDLMQKELLDDPGFFTKIKQKELIIIDYLKGVKDYFQ
ncbi:MAG: response regulator [Candidatus Heimdallarchaeota archaeon]|nr:response regulator [Candidatus Heimdallarchaeota archaeon]